MKRKAIIGMIILAVILIIFGAREYIAKDYGAKREKVEIVFMDPTIKNYRLLEKMQSDGVISNFEYNSYGAKAVVYVTAKQMEKGKDFSKSSVEAVIAAAPDNYEIIVNDEMNEMTILANCDADYGEVKKDYARVMEACEMYQVFSGATKGSVHCEISNRETGVLISQADQPGQVLNLNCQYCTGIDDGELALYTYNP